MNFNSNDNQTLFHVFYLIILYASFGSYNSYLNSRGMVNRLTECVSNIQEYKHDISIVDNRSAAQKLLQVAFPFVLTCSCLLKSSLFSQ
jgi:hypothetical protein